MSAPTRYWRRVASRSLVAVLAVLAVVLVSSGAQAAGCRKVSGHVSLQAFTDGCTSPIALCAHASLKGDLAGTATFVGSSITPTVDTPTTGVLLVTGDATNQTKDGGTLNTKDAFVLRTTGNGEFGEVDTAVGGTGRWAGATGGFRAQGVFAAGSGEGDYIGEVCLP